MNAHLTRLTTNHPQWPALVIDAGKIAVRGGVILDGRSVANDPIPFPAEGLRAGADYVVAISVDGVPALRVADMLAACQADDVLGGFHFAPGGNAPGTGGGDTTPAINPCSLWDRNFRPACPDPRGMTRVAPAGRAPFWCDIYLTAADHLEGTSRFDATIADDKDRPTKLSGKGRFETFDYETARAVLAHHGKQLLSVEEFFAAAYGVTERSAAGKDPKKTGLDAARTSRWGLMQATGNMWVWGHDGHPDDPRASLFGGSWLGGGSAGSRRANVASFWPGDSGGSIGARGRCDHLSLA